MKKKITAVGIVVAMLSTGLSSFAANTADYSDIPQGWAKDAIVYALDNGILKGDDGKVSPDRQLTRAEMAAIISRADTEEADISSYTDVSKDAWYYADMAKAVAAGVFNGYENKLNPEANITREEVFAVIQRAYKLSAENPADLSQFNDEENISDWAKDAASVLVAKGYINGADGSLNPKANITRAELAQIIYNISGKNNASENPNTTADPDATADPNATAAPDTTAAPTATPRPSSGGGSSSVRGDSTIYKTSFKLDDESNTDVSKVTVDGVEYYVAQLTKAMSSYVFTVGGKSVTPTAVNAEGTIVKYSADAKADTKKYAKTNLTYGEYWYPETSDGYKGELSAKFTKNGEAVSIPESYTAGQSAEDKYAAVGADSDAGMYDAVSRATTGYGLGRMSLKQDVTAKAADGSMQPFVSGIKQDGDTYTVVRPENAKENFNYDGSSNRGSNGEISASGIRDVVVAVSSDMLVNANILKDIEGYKSQAEAVIAAASKLTFDDTLTDENVYAYKELTSAGIYGKRVVNENVQAKEIGSVSEANTTENNTFTVNTKYGRRYGDVTFLIYFDDFKDMKAESGYGSANINGDDKTAGKVGEFKNYVYNVTGAKIEYLGADGKSEPIAAGAKFASDVWISPNHGPVVEVAVSNSYDRFKAFGDGQYRITLMADGYKDVVLETGASFNVKNPIEMQTEDDDIDEITGTDLVLTYNIVNQNYVNALKAAVEAGTSAVTLTSGKNTVASATKLEDKDGVLTVTFENVKDSLTTDTQYGVAFPTLDYNDPDKIGTTMSIHYAPADETSVELKDKVTVNGSDYYYAKAEEGSKFTLNGNEVEAKQIGSTGVYIYSEKPAEGTLYGTANIPYADFYYAELNDVQTNESTTPEVSADENSTLTSYREEGYYDAVSAATSQKSTRYTASNFEKNEESGTVKIYGIKDVPVEVNAELYAEAQVLNAAGVSDKNTNGILSQVKNITLGENIPTVYKTLYADGTYSKLNVTAETEDASGAEIQTGVVWGDYEVVMPESISENVTSDNIVGVVLTADDGKKYALRHSQNLWLRTNMFAWSVGLRTTEPHGNTLTYKAFEDMEGKTITNVEYIYNNSDGVITAKNYTTSLKVKHLLGKLNSEYGITSNGADIDKANGTTVAFNVNVPDDANYALTSVSYGGTAVEGYTGDINSITLKGDANKVGAYTAAFTSDKYNDVSVTFNVNGTLAQNEISLENGQLVISNADYSVDDYAAQIASVTVKSEGAEDKTYAASGRGSAAIFNKDGSVNTEVQSNKVNIFETGKTYTLVVKANGYSDFEFEFAMN